MILKLDIFVFLLAFLFWPFLQKPVDNEAIIRDIVYSRTEFILVIENLEDHKFKNKALTNQLLGYFEKSQPSILALCQNKKLYLQESDLNYIAEEVNLRLQKIQSKHDVDRLINNLLKKTIYTYSQIAANTRVQEDVRRYCLLAIPELIKIK